MMADVTKFDEDAYKASLAKETGVKLDTIKVEKTLYAVIVSYSFMWKAEITKDQAKQAIAQNAKVPPDMVKLTFSGTNGQKRRRLRAPSRRLGMDVHAVIQTTDAGVLGAIKAKAADKSALATALSEHTTKKIPKAWLTPTLQSPPKTAVTVFTSIQSAAGEAPVKAPNAAKFSATLSKQLGVDVTATIENEEVANTEGTTTLAAAVVDGSRQQPSLFALTATLMLLHIMVFQFGA